jgi:hypothetical protein
MSLKNLPQPWIHGDGDQATPYYVESQMHNDVFLDQFVHFFDKGESAFIKMDRWLLAVFTDSQGIVRVEPRSIVWKYSKSLFVAIEAATVMRALVADKFSNEATLPRMSQWAIDYLCLALSIDKDSIHESQIKYALEESVVCFCDRCGIPRKSRSINHLCRRICGYEADMSAVLEGRGLLAACLKRDLIPYEKEKLQLLLTLF